MRLTIVLVVALIIGLLIGIVQNVYAENICDVDKKAYQRWSNADMSYDLKHEILNDALAQATVDGCDTGDW